MKKTQSPEESVKYHVEFNRGFYKNQLDEDLKRLAKSPSYEMTWVFESILKNSFIVNMYDQFLLCKTNVDKMEMKSDFVEKDTTFKALIVTIDRLKRDQLNFWAPRSTSFVELPQKAIEQECRRDLIRAFESYLKYYDIKK